MLSVAFFPNKLFNSLQLQRRIKWKTSVESDKNMTQQNNLGYLFLQFCWKCKCCIVQIPWMPCYYARSYVTIATWIDNFGKGIMKAMFPGQLQHNCCVIFPTNTFVSTIEHNKHTMDAEVLSPSEDDMRLALWTTPGASSRKMQKLFPKKATPMLSLVHFTKTLPMANTTTTMMHLQIEKNLF